MIDQAIILAAGRGNRLKPLSDTMPKPMTEINGIPILQNTLDRLDAAGIRSSCIVVGYLAEKIIHTYGPRHGKMELEYVFSPDFATTNNSHSLWLARDRLARGCLLIEADVFFDPAVLDRLLRQPGSAWAVDVFTPAMNGWRLQADAGGRLVHGEYVQRSPAVPPGRYKSGGMLKIEPGLGRRFARWLDDALPADSNAFFDLILGRHLDEAGVFACNINGLRWAEVDDLDDLALAEKIFARRTK